jgi:hypothetical protein
MTKEGLSEGARRETEDVKAHMVVRPLAALSRAAWTTFSDDESRAEVASSTVSVRKKEERQRLDARTEGGALNARSRTLGFRMSARAIAIRCF